MANVLLIGTDGKKIGEFDFKQAQQKAKEQGEDLIMVNSKGNRKVYRMGDAGKLKYEEKQKAKKRKAQQRAQKTKEIQMRPTIDTHDLDIKLRRVREFLSDGLKTKLVMKFKKQQFVYRDSGMQKVKDVVDQLVSEGIASVDRPPKFEGRNINVFLTPKA